MAAHPQMQGGPSPGSPAMMAQQGMYGPPAGVAPYPNTPYAGPAHPAAGTHTHAAGHACPCCQGSTENPLSKPIEIFGVSSSDFQASAQTQDPYVQLVSYTADDPTCPPTYQQPCCPPAGADCCPPGHSPYPPLPGTPVGGYFTPGDEFICDGGDEGIGVAVDKDWTVRGLEIEDTIGHFDTLEGQRVVQPSNRVCIYAPRFGSVRKVYGIASKVNVQQLAGVDNQVALEQIDEVDMPSTTLQQLQPRGQVGSKSPSTFRDRTRGMELENEVASSAFNNRFNVFEDLSLIRYGIFDQDEKARLSEGIDAAEAWGRIDAPQNVVDNLNIDSLGTGLPAAETVSIEKPEGKPELRLCKVASTKDALPGDIVEFTIRFDNVGNETIGNVTILDHLSPRLELIDGSAECTLKADFFVTEQDRGTQIFRAEIVDPLPEGQGGIVRFKCRVR